MDRYLEELSDISKPLAPSKLANLSSLSSGKLRLFLQTWAGMDIGRRRQIINHLTELAEENCQLDFNDIFFAGLEDTDEQVRIKSIEGLWECESRWLIDRFIALLREDSKESVRAAAATALGRFVMLAELEKLRPEDGAKVASELFSVIDYPGEKTEVKRRAIEAIAPLGQPRVKKIIQEAYESEDARMRVSAIFAMGRSADPVWLPTLVRELGNTDAEMRFEAAVACGELGEEGAVSYLVRLVDDVDSQVQLSAITALGRIGGGEAEAALRECLNHPSEHIRQAAEEAMGELIFDKDPFSFEF